MLKVSPKTISNYRQWAQEDGYLRVAKPHARPKYGQRGDATEFRFAGVDFDRVINRTDGSPVKRLEQVGAGAARPDLGELATKLHAMGWAVETMPAMQRAAYEALHGPRTVEAKAIE